MQCSIHVSEDPTARTARAHPGSAGRGKVCAKGIHAPEHTGHHERILFPFLRDGEQVRLVEWEEALCTAAGLIRRTIAQYGPSAVGVYGGGSLTNEAAYLLGKFARVAIRTPNVDYNGRYCMSSAAAAQNLVLGLDRGLTAPLTDIARCAWIWVFGSNLAECQPTLVQYLLEAKAQGATIVVVDPRRTRTADLATEHLAIRPRGDLAFVNALCREIIYNGWFDRDYVERRTSGFCELAAHLEPWTAEAVEGITGIQPERIRELSRAFAQAPSAFILTARGVEQRPDGVETVIACLNLALLTGRVGQEPSGFGCVTGQMNGQGVREHGLKADQLPGYRLIDDPVARAHIASVWNINPGDIPSRGLTAYEMFEAIHRGEIRALFVMASNPVTSSPHVARVREAFAKLDALIAVDLFPTDTTRLAHVVLPAASFLEQEGTLTNLEGRVTYRPQVRELPRHVREDWSILCDLAERLGAGRYFSYTSPEEIFAELARASAGGKADYSGIDYPLLKSGEGVYWPCPSRGHPGTPRPFSERFFTPDGRARLMSVGTWEVFVTHQERPWMLTTGRVVEHYLTGVQTRRTTRLVERVPHAFLEMHPDDALELGVADGERVEVISDVGSVVLPVRRSSRLRRRTVFVPMHWEGGENVNRIVPAILHKISKIPNFKSIPVTIRKCKEEGEPC
ncbi:molybdopterin oxidoreductase family protein [Alicyclobacillus mali (ex Roth et al. 2021)]|uniref:molybdopterin oxidoreductase family protein n=1 Tax=Alicyclobacillus mali (ex Roth et al. 2021) TaxID=1123961 RepID=UPI001A8CA69C|nr:molybdopterin oxidoreductase family protein [Alicyclobacillus mali (ex Roth et al. 2021)]